MYFLILPSFKLHVRSSNVMGRVTCLALSLASIPVCTWWLLLTCSCLLFVSCFEERFPVPGHWLHSGGYSLGSGLGHQICSNCYLSHKGHLSLLPFFWERSSCGKCCLALLLSCRVLAELWRSEIVTQSRERPWQDTEAWRCNLIWFTRVVRTKQIIITECLIHKYFRRV